MSRPTTLIERTRAVAVAMIQWDFLRACVSKVDACQNNPCCRSGRGPSASWTEQHLRAWGFGRDQRREDAEDQAKSSGAKSRRRRRTKRLAQEFTNDIWTEQGLPDRTSRIRRPAESGPLGQGIPGSPASAGSVLAPSIDIRFGNRRSQESLYSALTVEES